MSLSKDDEISSSTTLFYPTLIWEVVTFLSSLGFMLSVAFGTCVLHSLQSVWLLAQVLFRVHSKYSCRCTCTGPPFSLTHSSPGSSSSLLTPGPAILLPSRGPLLWWNAPGPVQARLCFLFSFFSSWFSAWGGYFKAEQSLFLVTNSCYFWATVFTPLDVKSVMTFFSIMFEHSSKHSYSIVFLYLHVWNLSEVWGFSDCVDCHRTE